MKFSRARSCCKDLIVKYNGCKMAFPHEKEPCFIWGSHDFEKTLESCLKTGKFQTKMFADYSSKDACRSAWLFEIYMHTRHEHYISLSFSGLLREHFKQHCRDHNIVQKELQFRLCKCYKHGCLSWVTDHCGQKCTAGQNGSHPWCSVALTSSVCKN